MNKFLVLLIIATVSFSFITTANSQKIKDKYNSFLEEGEKRIETGYIYMISKTDQNYIKRVFYPENNLLTTIERYSNKKLSVKNGPAKYWHENGHLKMEGQYENNNKTGLFNNYHRSTGNLSSTGHYKNDKKQDTWIQYDSEGRKKSEKNYIRGKREGSFTIYDTLGVVINEGIYKADTIYSQTLEVETKLSQPNGVEAMPYLLACSHIKDTKERSRCSTQELLITIYKKLKYPSEARENGVEGMTITQFVINKEGRIEDIDVIVGICDALKNASIDVIKKIPMWNPGLQGGEPVNVKYTLPIRFKLQ